MKLITPTLLLALSLSANAVVSTEGLENYWTFDGNGEDTAGDFEGSANTVDNDAIIADLDPNPAAQDSVSFTDLNASQIGGAASFNSTLSNANSGGLVVGNNGDTSFAGSDLSISLWAQFDTSAPDLQWQTLISNGEGDNYRVAINSFSNEISAAFGGGDTPDTGTTNIQDGNFHHIVAVGTDGGDLNIYVDGQLEITQTNPTDIVDTGTGSLQNPDGNLIIGNNPGDIDRQWNGLIDDVGQFRRALTSEEITAIYEAGLQGNSLGSLLIPEPSSTALLGLGSLALAFRRRR